MFFDMYSDLVFESKPYYIYVLVHRPRIWVQAYMHLVSNIVGPRNISHRPYCDTV